MLIFSSRRCNSSPSGTQVRNRLLALLACCSAQCGITGSLLAEDPGSLQSRLEAIESQNAQLRQELSELRDRDELLATEISSSRVLTEEQKAAGAEDPKAFSAKWNNGFEATSKDKRFKYHVGGRVQFDTIFLSDSPQAFADRKSVV